MKADNHTQPVPFSLVTVMLTVQILKSFPTFARPPEREETRHLACLPEDTGWWGKCLTLVFLRPGDIEPIASTSHSSDWALML